MTDINRRHAEMSRSDTSREVRQQEPNIHVEAEAHVARARAMLGEDLGPGLRGPGLKKDRPIITKPLLDATVNEGEPVR